MIFSFKKRRKNYAIKRQGQLVVLTTPKKRSGLFSVIPPRLNSKKIVILMAIFLAMFVSYPLLKPTANVVNLYPSACLKYANTNSKSLDIQEPELINLPTSYLLGEDIICEGFENPIADGEEVLKDLTLNIVFNITPEKELEGEIQESAGTSTGEEQEQFFFPDDGNKGIIIDSSLDETSAEEGIFFPDGDNTKVILDPEDPKQENQESTQTLEDSSKQDSAVAEDPVIVDDDASAPDGFFFADEVETIPEESAPEESTQEAPPQSESAPEPEPDQAPDEEAEPSIISRLIDLFTNKVGAQELNSPAEEAIVEIFYSLDGESWTLLKSLSRESFGNLSIQLPEMPAKELGNLHFRVVSEDSSIEIPEIWLDKIFLSLSSDSLEDRPAPIEELANSLENGERVLAKEKVFKLKKKSFSASEDIEFEIDPFIPEELWNNNFGPTEASSSLDLESTQRDQLEIVTEEEEADASIQPNNTPSPEKDPSQEATNENIKDVLPGLEGLKVEDGKIVEADQDLPSEGDSSQEQPPEEEQFFFPDSGDGNVTIDSISKPEPDPSPEPESASNDTEPSAQSSLVEKFFARLFGAKNASAQSSTNQSSTSVSKQVNTNTKQSSTSVFSQSNADTSKGLSKRAVISSIKTVNPNGKTITVSPVITPDINTTKITIPRPSSFRPGKYEVTVEMKIGGKTFISTQDFQWGVLALNTDRGDYIDSANKEVYLQMGVLDDQGHTICNASLQLSILSPDSKISVLRTDDGSIHYSDSCGADNVTDNPDYFASYEYEAKGEYQMILSRLDSQTGDKITEISNRFTVVSSHPLDIKRIGATRINPFKAKYKMAIEVSAKQDFKGRIKEFVPADFEITKTEELTTKKVGEQLEIVWNLDLKSGEVGRLEYEYQAPKISPEFYLLGPIESYETKSLLSKAFSGKQKPFLVDSRQWQIANDAAGDVIILWEGATIPTGWTCLSCTGGNPFINAMPRASSSPGSSIIGQDSRSHTANFISHTSGASTAVNKSGNSYSTQAHTHTVSSPSAVTKSILPPYKNLKLISKNDPATLPAGAIAIFDVSSSSLPTGWNNYTAMSTKYLRTSSSTTTGGATSHNHAVTATVNAEGSAGAGSFQGGNPSVNVADAGHTHTLTATNTGNANNTPPYIAVVFAKLSATSSIPNGMIAMFDNATLPDDYIKISGATSSYAGKFLYGTSTFATSTGGVASHGHSTSTITSNSVSATSDPRSGGNAVSAGGHTHTFTFTINSATSLPAYRDAILAKYNVATRYNQRDYRFYAEKNNIQPDTPLNSENTTTTINSTSSAVRLRMNVAIEDYDLATTSQAFTLQFTTSSDPSTTTAVWVDVATSSTEMIFKDNSIPFDDATILSTLLGSSTIRASYEEDNDTASNPIAASVGDLVEWDFSLDPVNASFTTYFFRMIKASSGTKFSTYTRYPALELVVPTIEINGTTYSDTGSTAVTSTVTVAIDGSAAYTTSTNGSGFYRFTNVNEPATSSIITAWMDNNGGGNGLGSTVTRYQGPNAATSTINNLDIYKDYLITRHEEAGPITNANIGLCDKTTGSSCSDADLHFDESSGTLTIDKDWGLYLWTGDTFTPGGVLTLSPGAISSVPGGDLRWPASSSTLNVASNALNVGGDWNNEIGGTFTKSAGQIVTMTATSTGMTIVPGTGDFANITFNGSGGGWSFATTTTATTTENMTLTAGTVDTSNGSSNLLVNGSIIGTSGILNLTATNHQVNNRVAANQSFGPTSANWTFENLLFTNSDGVGSPFTITTQSGGNTITIGELLRVGGSSDFPNSSIDLNAASSTWILGGSLNQPLTIETGNFCTLTTASSTFRYTNSDGGSASSITSDGVNPYWNLEANNSATTFTIGGDITASNDFTASAGTYNGGGILTVVQDFLSSTGSTISAGNFLVGGSVTLNGTTTLATGGGTFEHKPSISTQTFSIGSIPASFNALRFNTLDTTTTTITLSSTASLVTVTSTLTIGDNTVSSTDVIFEQDLDINATTTVATTSAFIASSTQQFNLADDFINNGRLISASSTFVLDGIKTQTITGNFDPPNNFNVLEITNNFGSDPQTEASIVFASPVEAATSTAVTPNTKMQFAAGATTTFLNLNWNGQATSTPLYIRSNASGTQQFLVNNGAQSVANVDVKDSNACGGNDIVPSTGFVSNINTNCWIDQSITMTLSTTTIALPNLTPGTPVTVTSSVSINVIGADSGISLSVRRDNTTSTIASSTFAFPDAVEWNQSTPNSTTTNLIGANLHFKVANTGTDAGLYTSAWWGPNDTDGAGNAQYGGFPTSTEKISDCAACTSGTSTAVILYRANAPASQRPYDYAGTITYTALINP